MTILKDISILWALFHTLILFLFLFESRYPKRKTMTLTLSTMIPLILANLALFLYLDAATYSMLMLLTLSLPSFIVFWFLSKYRDGRFFFTFCMVDTIVLEIVYITSILNYYITPDTNILMFTVRLLAYPLLELFVYKKLRPMYLEVQRYTKNGWGIFAIIGVTFYVAITLLTNYPTLVTDRPEYLPLLGLLFILMPVIYMHIISTFRNQQKLHEATEQENILKLQANNMTTRIEELSAAEEKFRIERHNFRHKMQTIASLTEKKQYDKLISLVMEYNESIKETQVKHYCSNVIIDAVLSSYLRKAENTGIKVTTSIVLPEKFNFSEAEFAAVFANAIENAINACKKIPEGERFISIKTILSPHFMIQISNSFDGHIQFDENNIPVNYEEDHGFGIRYIIAFCEKNEFFYNFNVTDKTFGLQLVCS